MARTLPHNNEAEAAILGGILLRGQQALNDVLDIVSEDDFYNTSICSRWAGASSGADSASSSRRPSASSRWRADSRP